jgi:N-methylhydantoinase B/oxoprolinase/acetone carboxylase alpha subunit
MPVDEEVLNRVNPEEPTELEREWMDKIGVDEFSVYLMKLELICEEAKQNMIMTGLSPAIQGMDCGVGVYTAAGDLVAASVGTYLHICSGQVPIKYILKYYKDDPSVGIHEGDVFFCNDVLYGGFHNQDMLNIVPVFWKGQLVAWAVAAAHEPETGATEPAGYVPYAKSRYEEGVKAPPVRVGSNYRIEGDFFDFFSNMLRDKVTPHDLKAKAACCFKMAERLLEIIEDKGVGFFVGLMRRSLEVVYEAGKKRIANLNDGTYRHVIFFDLQGNEEALGCVHIALIKKGETLTIDLSGSSPPTMSFLNSKPHVVRGLLAGLLMQYLFADFPVSTGLLAPFEFKAPPGTIVNAPNDRAMSGSMRITAPVVNGVMVCLAKMLFDSEFHERVTSPPAMSGVGIAAGGGIDQYGGIVIGVIGTIIINGCGAPASPFKDGMDAGQFWFSGFADILDVEHGEVQTPVLHLFRNIMMDQGGPGKYRGGATVCQGYTFHNAKGPLRLIFNTATSRMPHTPGLMGGYAGGINPFLEIRNTDWQPLFENPGEGIPTTYQELATSDKVNYKATQFVSEDFFMNGDGVANGSGSSGGYGDVLERDPDLVMDDVRKGITSPWAATNVYRVAFDEETLEVNLEGTRRLREEERNRRRKQGKPYHEFMKEWLERKPSDHILRSYGPWPEGIA